MSLSVYTGRVGFIRNEHDGQAVLSGGGRERVNYGEE